MMYEAQEAKQRRRRSTRASSRASSRAVRQVLKAEDRDDDEDDDEQDDDDNDDDDDDTEADEDADSQERRNHAPPPPHTRKLREHRSTTADKAVQDEADDDDADSLEPSTDWCRYCGARYSSGWNRGPWGPRKLCTAHYVEWNQKGTLSLDEYPEEPTEPIGTSVPLSGRGGVIDRSINPSNDCFRGGIRTMGLMYVG